jgi:hypothetical protein
MRTPYRLMWPLRGQEKAGVLHGLESVAQLPPHY